MGKLLFLHTGDGNGMTYHGHDNLAVDITTGTEKKFYFYVT
jgi:hypothetical protein